MNNGVSRDFVLQDRETGGLSIWHDSPRFGAAPPTAAPLRDFSKNVVRIARPSRGWRRITRFMACTSDESVATFAQASHIPSSFVVSPSQRVDRTVFLPKLTSHRAKPLRAPSTFPCSVGVQSGAGRHLSPSAGTEHSTS
jgi:hypothetical protein